MRGGGVYSRAAAGVEECTGLGAQAPCSRRAGRWWARRSRGAGRAGRAHARLHRCLRGWQGAIAPGCRGGGSEGEAGRNELAQLALALQRWRGTLSGPRPLACYARHARGARPKPRHVFSSSSLPARTLWGGLVVAGGQSKHLVALLELEGKAEGRGASTLGPWPPSVRRRRWQAAILEAGGAAISPSAPACLAGPAFSRYSSAPLTTPGQPAKD